MKNINKLFRLLLIVSVIVSSSFSSSKYLQGTKDWIVPESAKKLKNPVKPTDESIKTGKSLYAKHCKSCHGTSGKGDGSKSKELETPCGDFTVSAFQSQSDGSIYYKIMEGRDDMPSYKKKITDKEDIWAMVNYMRTMSKVAKEKPKVEEKKEPVDIVKKTKEPEVKKETKKTVTEKKETMMVEDSLTVLDKTNIEFALKYYEMALNSSDTLAIVAPFDSNAIVIPTQYTTFIGLPKIGEYHRNLFKTQKFNVIFSIEATELSNDFAFIRARIKGKQTSVIDNKETATENGVFMVMKKTLGAWKIYYYMSN